MAIKYHLKRGSSNGYWARTVHGPDGSSRTVKRCFDVLAAAGVAVPLGMEVDHINGDRQDDRLENLRFVTHQQNCANRKGWAKSGLKGVYMNRRGKPWRAQINVSGKVTGLGTFSDPMQAAKAYDAAAIAAWGEHARTNFGAEHAST